MRLRYAAALYAVLAVALAAFAVPAFAGGHGGGGQGHDQSSQASQASSSGDNSSGVKPSNTTKHDTHADSSSSQTKLYGNGKTAGQIAEQNGYHGDLHGPGNSQPHKAGCGGHEVDVHALKAKGGKCGQTQQSSSEQQSGVKAAEHQNQSSHSEQSKTEEQQTESAQQTEQKQTESQQVAAAEHVTICHATGSATNPFVRISPSASGVFHGHMGHQDARDIIPPFTWNGVTVSQNWDTNGQAIWNAGCTQPAQTAAASQTQQTEQTQGAESAQSTQSAQSTEAAQAAQATQQQQVATATTSSPASAQAPASGVKGAVVALKRPKAKPAGGVLGATTRLGSTVRSARLPFTGLPLWPFLLFAAALVAMGLVARRAAADRRV